MGEKSIQNFLVKWDWTHPIFTALQKLVGHNTFWYFWHDYGNFVPQLKNQDWNGEENVSKKTNWVGEYTQISI